MKTLIFTKGPHFLEADELASRLKNAGCKILDNELFFLTEDQCAEHYANIVGESFYKDVWRMFETYPIHAFRVECSSIEDVLKVVGKSTNPRLCNKGSFRFDFGVDKTDNASHRSKNKTDARKEDKLFWGRRGFVARFREDPRNRMRVLERICALL